MALTSLKSLIAQTDDYSVGASPTGSTIQWDQVTQSEATSAEADAILHKKIILCWLIIHRFPDEGVLELIESVGEIWEFYSHREEETLLTPGLWKTKAKLGKTYIRPTFPVVEDED